LNRMLLPGRVKDFHRGLCFGLKSAGVRLAAFGGEVPEAVIGFNRAVGVEDVDEDFAAVARGDATQIGADLAALAIDRVTHRAVRSEYFLAADGIAFLFCEGQKLVHDLLAVGGDGPADGRKSLRTTGNAALRIQ